jgi:hypothetical protein
MTPFELNPPKLGSVEPEFVSVACATLAVDPVVAAVPVIDCPAVDVFAVTENVRRCARLFHAPLMQRSRMWRTGEHGTITLCPSNVDSAVPGANWNVSALVPELMLIPLNSSAIAEAPLTFETGVTLEVEDVVEVLCCCVE